MHNSKHRVLIVEDDANMRQDLEELLSAMDFEVVACGDKQTALGHVKEQPFCLALVDLQIFGEPGANRGHQMHGRSLVRELRAIYPHRDGREYSFPILVVSGYAREGAEAVEVMKDGASHIDWKLTDGGLSARLSSAIPELMRKSGREEHASCANAPSPTVVRKSDLELSIPGTRERRRTHVMFGERIVSIPDRSLKVLLHLIVGRLTGEAVHKLTLGAADDQGFKGISLLRTDIQGALPPGKDVIRNDHQGNYSLIDDVTIGSIAVGDLVSLENNAITELARRIEKLRSKSDGNS
jgi:CheY-like chemotaxis protein